jgi:hypothetical protein
LSISLYNFCRINVFSNLIYREIPISSAYLKVSLHNQFLGQARWYAVLIIPALWKLRQEDHECNASLDYIVRPFHETESREGINVKT